MAVPYLRAKLQDYYESLGGGIDSEALDDDMGAIRRTTVARDVCHDSFDVWASTFADKIYFL